MPLCYNFSNIIKAQRYVLEDKVMAISTIKATFQSKVQDVWDIVTSLEKYQWRSDLSKIEIISEK